MRDWQRKPSWRHTSWGWVCKLPEGRTAYITRKGMTYHWEIYEGFADFVAGGSALGLQAAQSAAETYSKRAKGQEA